MKSQDAKLQQPADRDTAIADKAHEIILESISEGVFTVDHNWRIMTFNRAAEEITGTPRVERRILAVAGASQQKCGLPRLRIWFTPEGWPAG